MMQSLPTATVWLFAFFLVTVTGSLASPLVSPLSSPAQAIAVDGTGRIFVAQERHLSWFSEAGTLDGTISPLSSPTSLAVENTGTVLVTGISSIMRLDVDGYASSSFSHSVRSFALQPDGQILAARGVTLLRLNPDGTPDPFFTNSAIGLVFPSTGIALQEDGRIVVASDSIVRLRSDGSRDPSFNVPDLTPTWVSALLVQPDGKILFAGRATSAGTLHSDLFRLNADGTLDSVYSPDSDIGIDALALQANGKIILSVNSRLRPATNIVRLNPDWTLDTTFPGISFDPATSIPIALLEDGSLVAGVSNNLVHISNNEQAIQSLTRDGSTLTWLRGGSSPEVFHTRFHASLDGIEWTDLGAGERISGGWRLSGANIPAGARLRARGYVTGTSYYVDCIPGAPALYSQPTSRTNNFGTSVTLSVAAKGLEPLDFQWFLDGQPIEGAKSTTLSLTNLNGGNSGAYHLVVSNSAGSSTSHVAQLTVIDPILLAQPKSIWVNAGTNVTLSVDAIGSNLAYQWKRNGQNIPGATSPTLEFSNVTPEHTGTYQVAITGTFGSVESQIFSVRVNTALPDLTFNPPIEATSEWFPIQTAVAYNNEFYIGGFFRLTNTHSLHHLIKVTADGSVDPLFAPEPSGGEPSGVAALHLAPNGQLLVGGTFLNIAGQSQPYLARLNPDGTLDPQFRPRIEGTNIATFTSVSGIEVLPDDRILIAGVFTKVNDQPRPGLALLSKNGELDETFNPHPNDAPRVSYGAFLQPNGIVVAYGWDNRRFNLDGTLAAHFSDAITGGILPLANGDTLVNSQSSTEEPLLVLLNPDGQRIRSLTGLAAQGGLSALQVNGQFISSRLVEVRPVTNVVGNGATGRTLIPYAISRFDLEGVEDPALSPLFDGIAAVRGMRGDGSVLVAGYFTNVAGFTLPKLALVKNSEVATQTLTLSGTDATWFRSGTSREVNRTVFEFSPDGITWTNLAAGVRIPGGWQATNLQVPSTGFLRARGFAGGSIFDTTIELSNGIRLQTPSITQAGQVALHAYSTEAARAILQMSTDLRTWTNLQTNSTSGNQLQLTVPRQPGHRAFYRFLKTPED